MIGTLTNGSLPCPLMYAAGMVQGSVARWTDKQHWDSALPCALLHGGACWALESPGDQTDDKDMESKVRQSSAQMFWKLRGTT